MVRVMIVEDDPMVSSINRKYIEKAENMKVTATFRDGKDALAFLENEAVDLIILDIYMHGMSGLEFLYRIREKKYPTEVIMVTAANDIDSLREAMNWGILDYLIKPFTYERFRQSIEKYNRKYNLMKNPTELSQKDIDKIVACRPGLKDIPDEYEKGINSRTLQELFDHLVRAKPGSLTSEELSVISGFSKVTVRRYMNYLVDHDAAESFIDYKTGGRPSVHYKARD